MNVIREENNVGGLPLPNRTRLIVTDCIPDNNLITCSFVLAFKKDKLLLTNLNDRGWDIPGGHTELGESPEETARRELYEETGVNVGDLDYLGYEEISLLGNKPDGYKYPFPNSYMVFYCAEITSTDEYHANFESSGRELFSPLNAKMIGWVQDNLGLYEEALKRINKSHR